MPPGVQAQAVSQPIRLPLVLSPENRDDSVEKDARLVNGYMEKDAMGDSYHLYKRPGLTTAQSLSGAGRGSYNWRDNVYEIFGSTIYKNGVSHGTGLDTTNGVYRFDSTLGGTPRLVFGNGVKAYYTDGTTVTEITDADFPNAFVKGWAFLDGTLYVGTEDPAIFGSELNDPVNWEVDNLIIPQIEPDFGVALSKQLVYVLMQKQWTTEVFYDQANTIGSPLGAVQGAKINFGCIAADSVQRIGDVLIWAAITREPGVQVVMVDNLKAAVISTRPVERLLTGADFSTTYSWTTAMNGHRFYVLTLVEENLTLVYDLTERLWSQWADTNGDYLPIVSATFTSSYQALLQHESNGKSYLMSPNYFTDDGSLFSVDLYTPNFDGGVKSRRKTISQLNIVADQIPGALLNIRTNDADYQAGQWSNFRTVDLGQPRPFLNNWGTFYRRATHLQHRANTKLRIVALEPQMDIGTL